MTRIPCLLAVLTLSAGLARTADALEPLERFSRDVDVVVRLKAPETTIDKVVQFAEAVQPGTGDMVRQNAEALGMAISVPSLSGVDRSRDWYVFTYLNAGEQPNVVFAIPSTDAGELTDAITGRMQVEVEVEGDWVLYTASTDGVPEAASPNEAVHSVLTGELADVFNRGDLSVFVNLAHLSDTFSDEIARAEEQATAGLEQIVQIASQGNGMSPEGLMDMYSGLLSGAFQAVDDGEGFSVAVTVTPEQVGIEEYATFKDGSVTAERVTSQHTSTMAALAKMPTDSAVYFGLSGNMQSFIEWSLSFSRGMLQDDAQVDKFEELMEKWQDIDLSEMSGAFSLGNAEGGIVEYTVFAQAKPINKVRELMRTMSETMNAIEFNGLKQEINVKPDAETIGSHSVDVITVKQEYSPELDPTGQQAKMMELMFGPDGMVSRIAYLDDSYVQTMGGGQAAMKAMLESVTGEPNADIAQHRAGLIEKSNFLIMVDLPNLAIDGIRSAAEAGSLPMPVNVDDLSDLEIDTSYLGFTLAGESNAVRLKTVVPDDQVRGIMMLVKYFTTQAPQQR